MAILGVCGAALLVRPGVRPRVVLGNHANGTLASSGIGFAQISQNGYINVYVGQTQFAAAAQNAIDAWRARQVGSYVWLAATTDPAQAQVEIIDGGSPSIFGNATDCSSIFPVPNLLGSYGKTLAFDSTGGRNFGNYWDPNPGHPFVYATVCLNASKPNNQGTVAHELGHALGLDHPTFGNLSTGVFGPCPVAGGPPDLGYDSIMAYNNLPWSTQYPVPATGPTWEDVSGPWVCDDRNAAGLAYIYQIPPYYGWPPDEDGDGLRRFVDNCWFAYNPGQENTDGDFINLHVIGKLFDDTTAANSDALGDACDPDIDNDGLTNIQELGLGPGGPYHSSVCPGATANADPTKLDTDGDGVTDRAECMLGTDPTSAASKPPTSYATGDADHDGLPNALEMALGTNPNYPETDGDKLPDGVEFWRYGSDPLNANTDGDICNDGKEAASVNDDMSVNIIDLLIVAKAFGPKTGSNYVRDFDVNRDDSINVVDLLLVAKLSGTC